LNDPEAVIGALPVAWLVTLTVAVGEVAPTRTLPRLIGCAVLMTGFA
jgi:hypothetical protein